MNIINKVTLRHLKENKRRTLVTIIGVIISVAMITAVAALSVSFLDLVIREDIAKNGEWHVQYEDVTVEQLKAIEKDSETKKLILSSDGYAALAESNNAYKPYVYFKNYNKIGMEQFPIEVIDGRLPQNENEIAISETIITNAKVDYKIGDQLTFNIGERVDKKEGTVLSQTQPLKREQDTINEELNIKEKKTAAVVGIIESPSWEPAWSPGYTVIGYVDEQSLSKGETIDALVVLEKVKGSLYEHANHLAAVEGIAKVRFNSDLLRYYGVTDNDSLRQTLYSLVGIIMGIIIIGSVALIYNAFAISVSERARHLGMLSSVGATKKQKRNSVFFEGAVIGAISIPIGILAGLGGIGATFVFINTFIHEALGVTEKMELVVTPASILLACGVSILTIFISTYIPAQKASKVSAIDAIRQTHDIKLTRKTVKTSKLVRKIFGLEAEIGLKNVKRNKKRYIATVFSLVISIVLFLTVAYFTENLKKSLEMSRNDLKFDIQVYNNQFDREGLTLLTNLPHVTKTTLVEETQAEVLVEMEKVPALLKKEIQEQNILLEDGKSHYSVVLHSLDDESFQEYAEQIGADPADFSTPEKPKAIVIDQVSYQDYGRGTFIETKTIESKVGDRFDLFKTVIENEKEEPKRKAIGSVQIGALTAEVPIGVQTASLGGVNLIVTEAVMKKLPLDEGDINTFLYLNSSDPAATQEAIEERKETNLHVYNVYQQRQQEGQTIMLLSIFTYGFITLISLISIANIFNTISTSISLRKREFAMLRSVGMTPEGFNKMVRYESLFYGLKALFYGLPLSVLIMFSIHRSFGQTFEYGFTLPWGSILFVTIVIFVIIGSAMLYSIAKIKNENIIESLKQENL